jgi:hypothetical protein
LKIGTTTRRGRGMGKGALAISERELEGEHLAWLIDTSPNARRRSSGNAKSSKR